MNSMLSYFKNKAQKKSMVEVDSEPEVAVEEQNQQHERQIEDIEEEKQGGVQIADTAGETVGGEPDLDTTHSSVQS